MIGTEIGKPDSPGDGATCPTGLNKHNGGEKGKMSRVTIETGGH